MLSTSRNHVQKIKVKPIKRIEEKNMKDLKMKKTIKTQIGQQ